MTIPTDTPDPAPDPERIAGHRRAKAQRALRSMLASIEGAHLTHYDEEIVVMLTVEAAEQLVEKLKKKTAA